MPTRKFAGVAVLLVVLVAGILPATAEEDNRAVQWVSYRAALEKGSGENLPVLVQFMDSRSGVCRKMKRKTYQNYKVIRYLNANFAAAMVEVDEVPSLARKFNAETAPVLWLLDANGKRLTSIEGEVGPEKLLRVAEYVSKKIYEKMDYNTWLGKRSRR